MGEIATMTIIDRGTGMMILKWS